MSKKMKRAAVEAMLPAPDFGDAKVMMKQQGLLQDYEDLQKEVEAMRNRFDAAKERKQRLLDEVRFLRRRHKHLTEMKHKQLTEMKSLGRLQAAAPKIEKKSSKTGRSTKGRNSQKKEAAVFKLPPLPDVKPKGKLYYTQEVVGRPIAPALDLNHGRHASGGGKEASLHSSPLISELNHRRRLSSLKEAMVQSMMPAMNFNLNQQRQVLTTENTSFYTDKAPNLDLNMDSSSSGKEVSRAPIFDLNEISAEEEELQNAYDPLKFEEQPNDLKLSVCRNTGFSTGESSSRIGKRKISWQDPVALRV